ncbi:hypothetical protein K2X33_01360 [bacterium]|nr:hypothetical protein [bacterium]
MFALAGLVFGNTTKKSVAALALWAAAWVGSPALGSVRDLASMPFPNHKQTSDTGTIMDDYPEYLAFVLDIAKDTDPKAARLLEERYSRLVKADDKLAARFLKGLRFEIVQKLELSGISPKRLTSDNSTMRNWVSKYIGAWVREVDEYQYRAYAAAIARR